MSDAANAVSVAVFGTFERADRARAELRAEGCPDDRLGVVWDGPGGPGGDGGLGAGAGGGVAAYLVKLGVCADAAEYYAAEAAGGRWLLLVAGAAAQALVAVGRHGGTAHVPPDSV